VETVAVNWRFESGHMQRPVSVSGFWGASSLIALAFEFEAAGGPDAQVIVRTILKRALPDIILA
jgi:hypothetical protein